MIFLATLLLAVIYAAFIGLSIPRLPFRNGLAGNLFNFNIPISFGSFVTVIISLGTIVSKSYQRKIIFKIRL